jgi:hypothetical protein
VDPPKLDPEPQHCSGLVSWIRMSIAPFFKHCIAFAKLSNGGASNFVGESGTLSGIVPVHRVRIGLRCSSLKTT